MNKSQIHYIVSGQQTCIHFIFSHNRYSSLTHHHTFGRRDNATTCSSEGGGVIHKTFVLLLDIIMYVYGGCLSSNPSGKKNYNNKNHLAIPALTHTPIIPHLLAPPARSTQQPPSSPAIQVCVRVCIADTQKVTERETDGQSERERRKKLVVKGGCCCCWWRCRQASVVGGRNILTHSHRQNEIICVPYKETDGKREKSSHLYYT